MPFHFTQDNVVLTLLEMKYACTLNHIQRTRQNRNNNKWKLWVKFVLFGFLSQNFTFPTCRKTKIEDWKSVKTRHFFFSGNVWNTVIPAFFILCFVFILFCIHVVGDQKFTLILLMSPFDEESWNYWVRWLCSFPAWPDIKIVKATRCSFFIDLSRFKK